MDLRQASRVLREQGFYKGDIEFVMSPPLADALRRFQEREGIEVTGSMNEATHNALVSKTTKINRKLIKMRRVTKAEQPFRA